MFTAMQASLATPGSIAKMAVITLLAPLTTQARILIGQKCDDIRRKARRTGLAENPPFGSDTSLAIDPGRANQAHQAVWIVGFVV